MHGQAQVDRIAVRSGKFRSSPSGTKSPAQAKQSKTLLHKAEKSV
jgi:hypothetical protein